MNRPLLLAVSLAVVASFSASPAAALADRSNTPAAHRRAGLVVKVAVSPEAFSPNDDGVKDQTTVTVTTSKAVRLTAEIKDSEGTVVRTLADGMEIGAGATEFEWRGYTLAGETWVVVPHGGYRIVVEATDTKGRSRRSRSSVFVDLVGPKYSWGPITPEPLLSKVAMELSFDAVDRSEPIRAAVSVFDAFGRLGTLAGSSRPSGQQTLSWLPRYADGHPLNPGLYRVRLSLTDGAGNTNLSSFRSFRVHWPVRTQVWRRVDGAGAYMALSFDDCNSGRDWKRILDILAAHRLRSNFFCSGTQLGRHPFMARRTVSDGHTIGSHGWDHAYLPGLAYDAVRARLTADQVAWWKVARSTPSPYFRPPYGAYDSVTLDAAGDTGYLRLVNWDVDPQDWARPGASTIVRRVLGAARGGSIVVLHVLPQTAAALPAMIDGLRAMGLRPSLLGRLFMAAGRHGPAQWPERYDPPTLEGWLARCPTGCAG